MAMVMLDVVGSFQSNCMCGHQTELTARNNSSYLRNGHAKSFCQKNEFNVKRPPLQVQQVEQRASSFSREQLEAALSVFHIPRDEEHD
jgi:hypothetical protein